MPFVSNQDHLVWDIHNKQEFSVIGCPFVYKLKVWEFLLRNIDLSNKQLLRFWGEGVVPLPNIFQVDLIKMLLIACKHTDDISVVFKTTGR